MINAVTEFNQEWELTCAGRCAFTGSTDGFLTPCSCLFKLTILAARAVSVTGVKKTFVVGSLTPFHGRQQFNIVLKMDHSQYFVAFKLMTEDLTCTANVFWICNQMCSRGRCGGEGAQGHSPPLPPLWNFHILCCSSPWSTQEPWNATSFQQISCCSWRNASGREGKAQTAGFQTRSEPFDGLYS